MPRTKRKYEVYMTVGFDLQGKRIRKYIGSDSKAEFERLKYEAKKAAEEALLSSGVTFGEYADKWLEVYKSGKAIKTYEMYKRAADKCSKLRRIPLKDITATDLQAVINENAKHARTCQQIKLTLKQIYEQAIADRVIPPYNLAGRLSLPQNQKREKRAFTAAETSALAKIKLPPHCRLFVDVLQGTGMRPGEALALQWGDIDTKTATITVRRAVTFDGNRPLIKGTKTGVTREIPISKKLARKLSAVEKTSVYVFADHGRLYSKSKYKYMLSTVFDALDKKLGAKTGLNFYSFRHTYATNLYYKAVQKGIITTKKAAQIMGHSEQMFISKYTHLCDEKEGLDKLRRII